MRNKSAKKTLKNNGSSTDPCRTPKIISNQELEVLFNFVICCRCDKQF